jgi:UDPglucose--hexose-1-phosphate uridylyltransferase
MPNYIHDISKSRWMVSNPDRLSRTGMDGKSFRCPFCPGNEADTPPEIYRVGDGEANKPGWQIRVVPNMFPITEIHEVIIHSPDHEKNIEDFSLVQVENIIKTYINRFNFLKGKGKVFIFHNYSLVSGASLVHPHSQVSVVPNEIPSKTLAVQPIVNIVEQKGEFVSYCPDYSEWAYEIWIREITNYKLQITNKLQISNFKDFNEKQISDLAKILQSSIIKLKKIHDSTPQYAKKTFGYNFYIPPGPDWYLRIIPRFMERAGFELSTGIMVNSVEAKKANEELKKTS